jgi:hypothetical protein
MTGPMSPNVPNIGHDRCSGMSNVDHLTDQLSLTSFGLSTRLATSRVGIKKEGSSWDTHSIFVSSLRAAVDEISGYSFRR